MEEGGRQKAEGSELGVGHGRLLSACCLLPAAFSILTAVVCLAVIAAPLGKSPWLYFAFSFACHQQPERSLHLAGLPLAVCARCWGIYLGALLGLLLPLASRRGPLLAALTLLALDWATEAVGLRPAFAPLRVVTGVLAGLAAAPVVLEGGTALFQISYRKMGSTLEGGRS